MPKVLRIFMPYNWFYVIDSWRNEALGDPESSFLVSRDVIIMHRVSWLLKPDLLWFTQESLRCIPSLIAKKDQLKLIFTALFYQAVRIAVQVRVSQISQRPAVVQLRQSYVWSMSLDK